MSVTFRHLQSLRETVNSDNSRRVEPPYTLDRHLSYRATAPDRDCVTRLDISILSGHISSREDICQEENLLVSESIFDLEWTHICKWDAHIFGLSACVAAHQM